MSPMLDHAVATVSLLPDAEQDAIAALMLEELEDERGWEESFARSPGKLAALAARSAEQVAEGKFRVAGFDEL